jgi:flavin reductase (DIM6/NTAB) family NADH-FMN oxidoreductase RutF
MVKRKAGYRREYPSYDGGMETGTNNAIDPREFRNTLGRFATGITVVTMKQGEETYGITVNAFMSVSLEPPLVLVSITKTAKAHATLQASEFYGVSILSESQEALSNHFAGRPMAGLEVPYVQVDGFPLIKDALAHLLCRVVDRVDAGDHTLFVGQVAHLSYQEGKPLLYFGGRYGLFELPKQDPLLDG